MTDVTRGVTPYSINDAHPNTRYGRPAVLPLNVSSPTQQAFFWAPLTFVPTGATVVSATITFYSQRAVTSAHTFDLSQVTSAWSSSITWTTRPTSTVTTTASLPISPIGTAVVFDITTQAQAIVAGTFTDRGWRLRITDAVGSMVPFYGAAATANQPILTVSWTMAPAGPDNLSPASGAVSVSKPTLTFDTDDDVIAVQVQVDPAANGTTPAFDSGQIAATGGVVDLSTTSYAGLSNGATTQWRARQKNSFGWSDWSDWVSFSRTTKATLTITSPTSSTINDGTPPIQWTFSGTQVSWRVRLKNAAGKVLADSGHTSGTATSWTPGSGFTSSGQTGAIVVDVWDNVDRAATANDPVYTETSLSVTFSRDATVGPINTLAAATDGIQPIVTLTGTRTAGIPDEVVVYRNGTQTQRVAGTSVFTGTSFTIIDVAPQMKTLASYQVACVTNGKVGSGGPAATVTPTAQGIWLIDGSDKTQRVVIRGDEDQEQSAPETSIEHTPLGGDTLEVVRRRLVRMPPQGTISGYLSDGLGTTAAACEALLTQWESNDAGYLYWLVLGSLTISVIVGDLTLTQTRGPDGLGQTAVTFNWWGRA